MVVIMHKVGERTPLSLDIHDKFDDLPTLFCNYESACYTRIDSLRDDCMKVDRNAVSAPYGLCET